VRRGLADSRERAQSLIRDQRVRIRGVVADKPARQVDPADPITVSESEEHSWASRGALKLVGALDDFGASGFAGPAGRRCLDAGASTGGFTDVLLAGGATTVLAVDVGYGQLHWRLRTDERVQVLDRTNIRHLTPADLPWRPELLVADLSFISLRTVLSALSDLPTDDGDMLLMVKPQFEVGREKLGKSGVVRDPELRAEAVSGVCQRAWDLGWGTAGVVASKLPGPSGNVEYFVWLRRSAGPVDHDVISAAIAGGPQT